MGLSSPSLKSMDPLRMPKFMAFHGLKIRASHLPWSKLSTMLLGAKEKESLDLTS